MTAPEPSISTKIWPLTAHAEQQQLGADRLFRVETACILVTGEDRIAVRPKEFFWLPSQKRFAVASVASADEGALVHELRIRRSAFAPNCVIDLEARHVINAICDHAHRSQYQLRPERRRNAIRHFNACFRTAANVQLKGFVCLLLDSLSNGLAEPEGDWLQQAGTSRIASLLDYITLHYYEKITVADAMARTGLSRTHFHRAFRHVTGTTLSRFVAKQRVTTAAQMLRNTDEPVLSIAFACGFNSVSQFYQVFKDHHDTSPKDYRLQHR